MQVLRNTYKSRCIAYDDDAYNLPLDTIYFIESKWNYRLNEYVFSHQQEITNILQKDFGGFFPYKFEIVSIEKFHNLLLQKAFSDLHPEWEDCIDYSLLYNKDIQEQEHTYQAAMIQRLTSKNPVFEETFIARIVPSEKEDSFEFYAIDTSLCTESLVPAILEKYIQDLTAINISILGKQDTHDYTIHDEVLNSRKGHGVSFCGAIPQLNTEQLIPGVEINKLNIDSKLRDLVLTLKDDIDAYQRTNGINVLLENRFAEFIKSFEHLETKPLSSLVIDNTYAIHLADYKKEVKMYTLPKTLYIFFLRHPEGIYLKDIADYRGELIQIYRLLTTKGDSIEQSEAVIDRLIDTTQGNLLCQYMCRISEAFRNVLSTDLAKKYTIAGKRNELRRITLDTTKILLPEKIKNLTATLRL